MGVGGTPASFARAGTLGLPLMVAIIGGSFSRFRPLIDLYRESGRRAGIAPDRLKVGVHAVGFVAETTDAAKDAFYPGWHDMWSHLGRERGWPEPTPAQFDALCAPDGAYLIGDPDAVAAKLRVLEDALGGVARVSLQNELCIGRSGSDEAFDRDVGHPCQVIIAKAAAAAASGAVRLTGVGCEPNFPGRCSDLVFDAVEA